MACNDFKVSVFMKGKGDQATAVACDEVFSALFQVPVFPLVECKKALIFKVEFCVFDCVIGCRRSFQKFE